MNSRRRFHCQQTERSAEVFAQLDPQGFRQGEKHLNDLRVELRAAAPTDFLTRTGKRQRPAMRKHCEIGSNMLIRIPFLRDAAEIVLSHQEFFDGTGYPRGLKGEEIPLGARIFAVADALDTMISDQP